MARLAIGDWTALAGRIARDPRLIGVLLSKLRSRWTLRAHQIRAQEVQSKASADLVALLAGVLDIERAKIEPALAEPALGNRISSLESWLAEPGTHRKSGAAYLEALYALVRILKPTTVVETEVARGFATTALLTALHENGHGELWSTDLPPFDQAGSTLPAEAMPADLRRSGRWHHRVGPDRWELPKIFEEVGQVDLFHYDSDKSYEGMRWALHEVWSHLAPGGVLVLDDAHSNDAFLELSDELGLEPWVIAKPTGQGVYRSQKPYYVGILRKPADG